MMQASEEMLTKEALTTTEDNIEQVVLTKLSDTQNSSLKHDNYQSESDESIQKKCYILRKLLAHQIKPNLGCFPHTIRSIPRLKPLKTFGSVLEKGLPYAELFSHPNIFGAKTTNNSDGPKFQLLGPFSSNKQDISRINQMPAPIIKDDHINIFGAMAVSFKADFLQTCAAALLSKRVSKLFDFYRTIQSRFVVNLV